MRVLELWRYPVKSLQGERLAEAEIGPLGIPGDRGWALFDRDTGLGLTARRVPELLFGAARVRPDGGVEVVLPDGTVTADEAVLSDWLGRRVELRAATENTGDGRARARLSGPAGTVELELDEAWPWLQVFSGDTLPEGRRRRSLAVEPMTCPPNALADHADLVVLAPGADWSGTWTLRWTPAA